MLSLAILVSVIGSAVAQTCPPLNIPRGQSRFNLQRPEGTRQYYVNVPRNYNPNVPTPLIFAFHGFTEHCLRWAPNAQGACTTNECYMTQQSEAQGFILAYACGWELLPSWNAGTCCGLHSNNDVQFTRDMIRDISSRLCVDSSRTFSTGFSNGGMLSNRLACDARELVRGVAAVAGPIVIRPGMDQGLTLCDESYRLRPEQRPVNFLSIHGTLDIVVPYTGNGLLGFPPARQNFDRWAARNECRGSTRQTLNRGSFSNVLFDTCAGGSQVELVTWAGGSHAWPRTTGANQFDAAQYVVSFFRRISEPWPAAYNESAELQLPQFSYDGPENVNEMEAWSAQLALAELEAKVIQENKILQENA